jgi:uncharacterized protein YbaR (Trm112 family)
MVFHQVTAFDLTSLLACPRSSEPIVQRGGLYAAERAGLWYPAPDGTPILLPDAARARAAEVSDARDPLARARAAALLRSLAGPYGAERSAKG